MSGYSIDYAQGVFQLARYKPTITSMPFADLIKQMHRSKLVIATGIGRTPERENDLFWVAPMAANVSDLSSIVDDYLNSYYQKFNE